MEARLEVSYDGFDPKLDEKIIEIMKKIDAEWYISGYDHKTKRRDICFDLEVK